MDLVNVSMVIAPNLFMALPSRSALDEVGMAARTSQIVRLLIKYHKLLWTVSWCRVCVCVRVRVRVCVRVRVRVCV